MPKDALAILNACVLSLKSELDVFWYALRVSLRSSTQGGGKKTGKLASYQGQSLTRSATTE